MPLTTQDAALISAPSSLFDKMEPGQNSFNMPQATAPDYAPLRLRIKSPTMTRFLFCTEGSTGLVTIYRKSQVLVERKINQGVPLVFIIYEMITGLVSCTWAMIGRYYRVSQKRVAHRILNALLGQQIFGPSWPNILQPCSSRDVSLSERVSTTF